jgi:hypothetical protein
LAPRVKAIALIVVLPTLEAKVPKTSDYFDYLEKAAALEKREAELKAQRDEFQRAVRAAKNKSTAKVDPRTRQTLQRMERELQRDIATLESEHPGAPARVTIVIPTRDRLHLLQECVELLEETVDWKRAELIIVDDHSRDTDAVRYLETIQRRPDLRCRVVRPTDRSAPFNYSHLVNLAGPLIETPLVLHLNNDVNALERGWLEEMVSWFRQPDVGVVVGRVTFMSTSTTTSCPATSSTERVSSGAAG